MMVVISVRNIKAKARDVERVSEMNSMITVLGLYHADYNLYPVFDDYITGIDDFSVAIRATKYISNIPTDPSEMDSNSCGSLTGYHYYYQSTDGRDYILGYCLETNSMQGRPQGENYLSP